MKLELVMPNTEGAEAKDPCVITAKTVEETIATKCITHEVYKMLFTGRGVATAMLRTMTAEQWETELGVWAQDYIKEVDTYLGIEE